MTGGGGLADLQMYEAGQSGRLISQEDDLASLREWQAGLNGSGVKRHLAENLSIRVVLRIEECGFGKESGAPSERKHAATVRVPDLAQAAVQFFDGGFQERQPGPL